MRFKPRHQPRSYLNRSEQYRLLGLCVMLFATLWAFQRAADPRTWAWLFQGQQQQPEEELQDISYLVRDASQHLKPDEFIGEVLAEEDAIPATEVAAPNSDLTLDPALFEPVLDQTIGWRSRAEYKSLLQVVDKVRGLDAETLTQAAQRDISFRFLNQQPEVFRGKVIYLHGTLWRLETFREGDDLTDPIYTGWMFTEDSGNKPWMVLCTDLPAGLTVSNQLDRPVTVSGYFFKRYGYETAEQQLNVAPLVVAKSFHLLPLPNPIEEEKRNTNATYTVLGVLVGAVLSIGLIGWFFWQSDRRFAKSRLGQNLAHGAPLPDAEMQALQKLEVAPASSVIPVPLPPEE